MRRQSRLFALAEYLRSRRTGVTAEALAERFGVTVRTIYRDLDALRDASLPLQAERGPGGGYALERGYTLPPVNFTPREAALLVLLGRWAREQRFLPLAGTLEAGVDKVRAALDVAGQRALAAHAERLQFVGIPALPVRAAVREAVEAAWLDGAPLRIVYHATNDAVTTRRVRITGFVLERTQTHLQCHDLDKDAPRTFRLDRVLEAHVERDAPRVPPAPASPRAPTRPAPGRRTVGPPRPGPRRGPRNKS